MIFILVLFLAQLIGLCFTYLFVCEFALKCVMLGFVKYVSDTDNLLDIVVVLTGMLETPAVWESMHCKLFAPSDALKYHCIETGGSGLGLLRCARLLKLGKLLNKFPSVAFQFKSIVRSMTDAYTVLFLLAIATFVFAILGVNVFGSKIRVDDLGSPYAALNIIRPGARVFVAGAPRYNESTETLVEKSNAYQEFPAIIDRIDEQLHAVRPLLIQPLYGYTFSSRPSNMLPFVTFKPEVSAKTAEHTNKHQQPQSMTLVAAIPRFNADTFWDGLLAAFQLSLGVDFGESLTLALGSGEKGPLDIGLSYFFFMLVIVLGNWILFNCFIATMIVSFRREAIISEQTKTRQLAGTAAKQQASKLGANSMARKENSLLLSTERFTKRIERMAVDGRSTQEVVATIQNLSTFKKKERMKSGELLAQSLMEKQFEYEKQLESLTKQEFLAIGDKNTELVHRCRILKRHLSGNLRLLDDAMMILTAPDTFGIFDPLNPLRIQALAVVRSQWFQQGINFLLLVSTVCLAMERREIGLTERNLLNLTNLGLNVVFTLELLVKSFALSFQSYLKDPLNRIDCIIVVFGVVDIVLTLSDPPLIKPALVPSSDTEIFGVLRILRIVKTMRPLRIVLFKIERVRIVVSAIKESIGPLQLAVSIAMGLVLILGVFAQQLFAGRMSACSDSNVFHRSACSGTDADGHLRVWRAPELNCDWIGDSVVLIFTAISKDRWRGILWSLSDITSRHTGPYVDFSWYHAILMLFAVIIGSVFTLNLLVALFVESYTKEMIAVRQRINDTPRCLAIQGRASLPRLWDRPRRKWRAQTLVALESKAARRFFTCVFFVNFFVSAIESYKSAAWSAELKRTGNALLALTFGAEAAFKMLALGPARYFDVNENTRDFVSALLTLVGEALHSSINQGSNGLVGRYFQDQIFLLLNRLLSVARLIGWVRVLRSNEDLQAMTNILLLAGGIVVQVLGILLIAMFVFGVIGVQLFGNICSPEDTAIAFRAILFRYFGDAEQGAARGNSSSPLSSGGASAQVDFSVNSDGLRCLLGTKEFQLPNWMYFNNLASAILTLFIAAMGDGWSDVMIATSVVSSAHPRRPGHIDRAVPLLQTYLADPLGQAGQMALGQARLEFPGCITGEELEKLGSFRLLDCTADGGTHCESTCGSSASKIFFVLYFMVSNVIILNIIVATLLEQVAASELPLQGALTVGLSMRKFHRAVNIWKGSARARTRLKIQPDPTLSLRAREQREIARESGIREEIEAEQQLRMDAKVARKLLLERRHAWRFARQAQEQQSLVEQVLQAAEFESRAQHLDDLHMAKQLAKHLRRHRQRERQLLERWRESLPWLVRQALVLDHWTGLPTIDFLDKERKLNKLIATCRKVAQERDTIWAAAAPDLEMQQGIMQDVSQFLAFVERELATVRLMIGSLTDELEALSSDDPAAVDTDPHEASTQEASTPFSRHARAEEQHGANADSGAAGGDLLADFDALRQQLKTNRIQAGKMALQEHGGVLVQALLLRRSAHLKQARRTQQQVEQRSIALEPINIPRKRATCDREAADSPLQEEATARGISGMDFLSSVHDLLQDQMLAHQDGDCQESRDQTQGPQSESNLKDGGPERRVTWAGGHRQDDDSSVATGNWEDHADALLEDEESAQLRAFALKQEAMLLQDREQATSAAQQASSRAGAWRDSLELDKIETVPSLMRHRLQNETRQDEATLSQCSQTQDLTGLSAHPRRPSAKRPGDGGDASNVSVQTATGDQMASVTGLIGHVTTHALGDESCDLASQARLLEPRPSARRRPSAHRGAAGLGGSGHDTKGDRALGDSKLIGGQAMLRELGIIPLHELEQRNGLLRQDYCRGAAIGSVSNGAEMASSGAASTGRRGGGGGGRGGGEEAMQQLISGLDVTQEMADSLSFTSFNSFAKNEVVCVRRKDGSLSLATIFQELPGAWPAD